MIAYTNLPEVLTGGLIGRIAPHRVEPVALADRLAEAMKGRSPGSLATVSGVGRQYIAELLKGEHPRPGYDRVMKLAAALRVDPNWLYYGSEASAPRWIVSKEQLKGWLSGEVFAAVESVIDAEVERRLTRTPVVTAPRVTVVKLPAQLYDLVTRETKHKAAAGAPIAFVQEDFEADYLYYSPEYQHPSEEPPQEFSE